MAYLVHALQLLTLFCEDLLVTENTPIATIILLNFHSYVPRKTLPRVFF